MISNIDLKDYTVIETIGSGGFGDVYKVQENKSGLFFAAKVSKDSLEDISSLKIRSFSREIKNLSKINHPATLKYIGFSDKDFDGDKFPVILTELINNGSLEDILSISKSPSCNFEWNDTHKLITIFGIASAMSYLHKERIIHRDLKTENILMDDFLCPKVADFGLSKVVHNNVDSIIQSQSTLCIKGSSYYIAPEVWEEFRYTTACDVYSYAMIVYKVFTGLKPFNKINLFTIGSTVKEGARPSFDSVSIPESYKTLIESCWAQKPEDRPTFEQIVNDLKTNKEYITDKVNLSDYQNYINYIENFADLNSQKQCIPIDKFVKQKTRTFEIIKVDVTAYKKKSNKLERNSRCKSKIEDSSASSSSSRKGTMIYPSSQFNLLSNECQILVEEAVSDSSKQFKVGQYLIEGTHNFPQNTALGIQYLEQSSNDNVESAIYYSQILIEGEIIPQDIDKAESILDYHLGSGNPAIVNLYLELDDKRKAASKSSYSPSSSIKGKMPTNKREIFNFYKNLAEKDNAEAMYQCGLILEAGDGVLKNNNEANRYFKLAADRGYVNAMYKYAINLKNGNGIQENKQESVRYFYMAARAGKIEAMSEYAAARLFGLGSPIDKYEALSWIQKSIERDDPMGLFLYSYILYTGDCGMNTDKIDSAIYLKKSADRGYASAMNSYAIRLQYGDGVARNLIDATRYFKMAIEKGSTDAMINYGLMLCSENSNIDNIEAIKYFKMAAENGDKRGNEYLQKI